MVMLWYSLSSYDITQPLDGHPTAVGYRMHMKYLPFVGHPAAILVVDVNLQLSSKEECQNHCVLPHDLLLPLIAVSRLWFRNLLIFHRALARAH